jgi:hypothetical protein
MEEQVYLTYRTSSVTAVTRHCCVINEVSVAGEHGKLQFAEAGTLTPERFGAAQQYVRRRVLRCFACAGTPPLDLDFS